MLIHDIIRHQIRMHLEDKEKTSFIIEDEIFCYTRIPFGLKNTSAIYKKLVNKILKEQLERNIEAYVDDMMVKNILPSNHVKDLKEVFGSIEGMRWGLTLKNASLEPPQEIPWVSCFSLQN